MTRTFRKLIIPAAYTAFVIWLLIASETQSLTFGGLT